MCARERPKSIEIFRCGGIKFQDVEQLLEKELDGNERVLRLHPAFAARDFYRIKRGS